MPSFKERWYNRCCIARIDILLPYLLRKSALVSVLGSRNFKSSKIDSFANLPTGKILSFPPFPRTFTKLNSSSNEFMLIPTASEMRNPQEYKISRNVLSLTSLQVFGV